MYIRCFLSSLFLLLTSNVAYGSESAEEAYVSAAHRTEVFPITDYERLLAEAKEGCAVGRILQYADGLTPPEAPSMEASAVLRPNASISRVFVSRSYEEYAGQCAASGEPTRLVVACGRLGHPPDPMATCPGHSDAYFTINTSANMQPDLLGDVFYMPEQAFPHASWNFIEFEGLSAFFDIYSEGFLHTLAKSLRPGGVWILNFDLSHFPSVIQIGSQTFKGGITLAETPTFEPGAPKPLSVMRMICREAGKMADDETAVFASFDDVRTAVNAFFVRRGFKSTVIRNTFLLKSDQHPEAFALIAGLTGEDSPGSGLFGTEIDNLVGDELLPKLRRDLEELALVIRG